MSEFVKLLDASLRVAVIVAVWPAIIVDRELASWMVGNTKSLTNVTDVLALEIFPAVSESLTVSTPPAGTAACNSAVVVLPKTKVTVMSPAEIVLSVAIATPSRYNVAVPPVASPATMVAVALRSVFVAVSLFAVTTPLTPVADNAVGAAGAMVSTTMAALAPNEPVAPGAINVRLAVFPAASLMDPPFNTSAPADCTSRSLLISPA